VSKKDFEGMITFTYYRDLNSAIEFYSKIMGLELVIDVDFAKIYRVGVDSHLGIVDGKKGYLKVSREKPVMLTFVVDDVEEWYKYLQRENVEIVQPPKEAEYLKMKTLIIKDPEGYIIEIMQFLTKPYGKDECPQLIL
jgi:predicted enzyme related to lactoylglutathione lyase